MNKKITNIFCLIFIILGFLALFSAKWCYSTYGDIGFDAILFTMFSDLKGVSSDLIFSYLKTVTLPIIFCTLLVGFTIIFTSKEKIFVKIKSFKIRIFPFNKILSVILSIILCTTLIYSSAKTVKADIWLQSNINSSAFIEENYVDPKSVKITFPDNKRNLIYIFMESMETTFFSKEQGGKTETSALSELYGLAENNINFSETDSVGGLNEAAGASWTIGALVAQTAGLPLKLPVNGNSMNNYSQFLPGAHTMQDILSANGYYQTFMCGSDSDFGGRKQYFEQHGIDKIYDLISARNDGIVSENYHDGWWGMEDYYLYTYAKQELTKISSQNKPFAFFMLTVDTHHVGGNVCEYCENEHNEQYENVYACASKQVNDFVNWIKTQAFYENTTVVICGDHKSMDGNYMQRNSISSEERKIYNCIINSAIFPKQAKNRIATQIDMFPTVLAAIGCEIEGNRLSLGTNLFSDKKTLAEKYGISTLNSYIKEKSTFYDNTLLRPLSN